MTEAVELWLQLSNNSNSIHIALASAACSNGLLALVTFLVANSV